MAQTEKAAKAIPRPKRKEQIEFRAPAAWIDEVRLAAAKLCLSVSAFVRLAVVEKMRRLDHDDS